MPEVLALRCSINFSEQLFYRTPPLAATEITDQSQQLKMRRIQVSRKHIGERDLHH